MFPVSRLAAAAAALASLPLFVLESAPLGGGVAFVVMLQVALIPGFVREFGYYAADYVEA